MPKPKGRTQKKKSKPTFKPKDARPKPLLGLLFLALFVLILVALWDYQPAQSRHITTAAAEITAGGTSGAAVAGPALEETQGLNLVGLFGAEIGFYALHLIGWAAWPTLLSGNTTRREKRHPKVFLTILNSIGLLRGYPFNLINHEIFRPRARS